VETTRCGIAPRLTGVKVSAIRIHNRRLRWPITPGIETRLNGRVIQAVDRRAKYLLLRTGAGTAIVHLGMSGTLRFVDPGTVLQKHDHVEIEIASGSILRFNDPRRFGCLLWTDGDPMDHSLLARLGPEPLNEAFDGTYLYAVSRGRSITIKQHLMNNAIVVGVGNIYANESLFHAGIHPARAAGRISSERMGRLAEAVKHVLREAIRHGGTTLRDFYNGEGKPGYFRNELNVYGRHGETCPLCHRPIRQVVLGQRSTFYCPGCQK